MKIADIPHNEEQRLKALYEYNILDTPCEKIFDTVTQLASSICNTSISTISLIDSDRQWFKSATGLNATETHRDTAFCAHTILGDNMMEVTDARKDERFHDNPFVTNQPKIRFYLGVPLKTPDGFNIGSLCVIDQRLRTLTEEQKSDLKALASIVVTLFESRKKIASTNDHIEKYLSELKSTNEKLKNKLKQEKELAALFNLFNQMYSMLQVCRDINEMLLSIKKYCHLMFPTAAASIYLSNHGTNYLNVAMQWNKPKSLKNNIHSDNCWGLRRGQSYFCDNRENDVICSHFSLKERPDSYLCLPLVTQGEILGLLCFEFEKENGETELNEPFMKVKHSFMMRLAEHIALAFANIRLRKSLHEQSIRDPLTNLYNRRYLYDYFNDQVVSLMDEGNQFGIMIIDIDYFKQINDTYGHYVGDEVLKQLSVYLNTFMKVNEIVYRIGGDEFVYTSYAKTQKEITDSATVFFKKLNDFKPILANVNMPTVTFSAGLVICQEYNADISALLKAADNGLYESKKNDRGKLIISKL